MGTDGSLVLRCLPAITNNFPEASRVYAGHHPFTPIRGIRTIRGKAPLHEPGNWLPIRRPIELTGAPIRALIAELSPARLIGECAHLDPGLQIL